jgi:medium-chain acyl-[acyl-carrier-protein] hydrolase
MNDITLIGFPHAGADANAYLRWANAVASQGDGLGRVRVELVNLPGRGRRYREPLLTCLDSVVDDVLGQVAPRLAGRYALFGHSMGAWLAYLTARQIRRRGLPPPFWLIVSGARPPRLGLRKALHGLDQQALVAELEAMGGFPQALLADAEALDYFLPILRADMEALASYRHRQEPALDIPITVFRGIHDTVRREDVLAWREESSMAVNVHEFDGNHFFVLNQASEVARLTRNILLAPAAPIS